VYFDSVDPFWTLPVMWIVIYIDLKAYLAIDQVIALESHQVCGELLEFDVFGDCLEAQRLGHFELLGEGL
jgi:hypothetical protein